MSTTAKHTPGTWRAFFNQPDESGAVTCSIYAEPDMSNPHRGYVADVYRNHVGSFIDDEEFRANARLIAAAPELLQTLQAVIHEIDAEIEQRQCGGNAEDWESLQVLSDAAHEAIAKAEGRS